MVTTGALIHGDVHSHLDFSDAEHPVALQLGGSEPDELVRCAKLGQSWGYDEINLNCGCPSERVQRGSFGACLMAEPDLVADCVKAMQDAVSVPVTVKHRLGINDIEEYEFVRTFVETLFKAGCNVFVIHARNAILKGLSPKDNRHIPPLKYSYVHRLKTEFPDCDIVVNGGFTSMESVQDQLHHVDGVMLGRAAYHDSYLLAMLDAALFGKLRAPSRTDIVRRMWEYARGEVSRGTPLRAITRHILGLYHGQPRARKWRQMLSDARLLNDNDPDSILRALDAVEPASMAQKA